MKEDGVVLLYLSANATAAESSGNSSADMLERLNRNSNSAFMKRSMLMLLFPCLDSADSLRGRKVFVNSKRSDDLDTPRSELALFTHRNGNISAS
ncbi:hypothetical protein GGI12_005415, partial [Dipsacomyces acuminosporus]